jgi:hypothetical protein
MTNNLRSLNSVQLPHGLSRSIDRKLGYMGHARLVSFHYEPRGEEVVWNDGRSYGFGSGGWLAFGDEIAPLAERYGVDLGSDDGPGDHVLVIDRSTRHAYFAQRAAAEAIVAGQGLPLPVEMPVHLTA